jgi:hypothetical protein
MTTIQHLLLGAVGGIIFLVIRSLVIAWKNELSERKRKANEKPYDPTVKCETCKHKVDKNDCKEVRMEEMQGCDWTYHHSPKVVEKTAYYCVLCSPAVTWDMVRLDGRKEVYVPSHYEPLPLKAGKKK